MRSEFWINFIRASKYIDLSVDWFLKSHQFKKKSPERQICMLKHDIYWRDAKKCLRRCNKLIERKLND